jgi:hypothetical protein
MVRQPARAADVQDAEAAVDPPDMLKVGVVAYALSVYAGDWLRLIERSLVRSATKGVDPPLPTVRVAAKRDPVLLKVPTAQSMAFLMLARQTPKVP